MKYNSYKDYNKKNRNNYQTFAINNVRDKKTTNVSLKNLYSLAKHKTKNAKSYRNSERSNSKN